MKTLHYKLTKRTKETMTVGELIKKLHKYDEAMPVLATWEGVDGLVQPQLFDVEKYYCNSHGEEIHHLSIDVEKY